MTILIWSMVGAMSCASVAVYLRLRRSAARIRAQREPILLTASR